jgi:hypothetical protein
MFFWVDQAIIVVQTCFHENIIFKESNVQYAFGQGKNSLLMGATDIPQCTLLHILSLSFLFVGLLRAIKLGENDGYNDQCSSYSN